MVDQIVSIGVVAPGRKIDAETADKVAAFAAGRYGAGAARLVFHEQCFYDAGHFAGPDELRAGAIVEMANDPAFDAIWFARGGYGAPRLPDSLFEAMNEAARAKTYMGYSDAGVLLAGLYKRGIGRVVHGPMPVDITRDNGEQAVARALDFLVQADRGTLEPSTRDKGKFAAFNITMLAHMCGTPAMPDLTDHVVMLEDIGEYQYALDRSLWTITSNPALQSVAGLQIGRCSDIPENDIDYAMTPEEIVQYWCNRSGIAYLGHADIGHDIANKIVVFGDSASAFS